MDVRQLVASGETYSSKRQKSYYERFVSHYHGPDNLDGFVIDCLQSVLNDYPVDNPPTLSLLSGPILAMNSIIGVNVRDLPVFKNFLRGYKQQLSNLGKTKNLTCPVFLDHAILLYRKILSVCSSENVACYKFIMLMKIYFGVRTGDILKIKYGHLKFLKPNLYTVGSDGRKGCSSVDSPTVYYVYRCDNPEFCLHMVIEQLLSMGFKSDDHILSARDRRK